MGHMVEFLPNYRSISIFDKEMPINPYCWFIIKNIEEDRCTKLYYRGVASGGLGGQIMPTTLLLAMTIRVVEISNGGHKIRKIFA